MTDELQNSGGEFQESGSFQPQQEQAPQADAQQYQQAPQAQPAEKTLTQSEVNSIVGRAKSEAYAKAQRDFESQYSQTQHQPQQQAMHQQPQYQPQQQNYGANNLNTQNMSPVNEGEIRRIINEEAQRQTQMEMAKKVADEVIGKIESAKSKYPDFEEKITELNLPTIPEVVQWANGLDNTADVLYDLGQNPSKYANILVLAKTAPHLAQKQLKSLSDSIKKNEQAKESEPDVAQPLSQVTPSLTSADNGKMSISDLRRQDWLAG